MDRQERKEREGVAEGDVSESYIDRLAQPDLLLAHEAPVIDSCFWIKPFSSFDRIIEDDRRFAVQKPFLLTASSTPSRLPTSNEHHVCSNTTTFRHQHGPNVAPKLSTYQSGEGLHEMSRHSASCPVLACIAQERKMRPEQPSRPGKYSGGYNNTSVASQTSKWQEHILDESFPASHGGSSSEALAC